LSAVAHITGIRLSDSTSINELSMRSMASIALKGSLLHFRNNIRVSNHNTLNSDKFINMGRV
jgi:hypothetical protein